MRPNIIFIMSDDHAARAISAYGAGLNATPNLDRLANEGMRHDATYVTNSICTPSRAAILTGTYNHVNCVTTLYTEIDNRLPNVAKHLRKGGYRTGMFGKWHMGEGPKHNPTGFDDWAVVPGQGDYWDPKFIFPDGSRRIPGYATDIITDMSIDFIEKSGEQPFFLMCHHKAPHRNFEPHPKYNHLWADEDIPLPETFNDDYANRAAAAAAARMRIRSDMNYEDLGLVTPAGPASKVGPLMLDFISWMRKVPELQPGETITVICSETGENFTFSDPQKFAEFKYQRYMKRYLRTVQSIDENVGRLLDYLDEKGLADNTIVIYTSDQGFFLGEHGWFDKRFMYEESLQMPFLARYPAAIKAGSVSADISCNVDFAPTFLDYAGLPIPSYMQGRSMRPVLEGQTPADWEQLTYHRYWMHNDDIHEAWAHYGVRDERYKLIYWYNDDLGQLGARPNGAPPEWELFDCEKDPHELTNVAHDPAYAGIFKEMLAKLDGKMAEIGDVPEHDSAVVLFLSGSVIAMTEMTKTIDGLLDAMTLAEQVSLLSGEDFWSVPAIERLGIGKLRVSDGPNGARGGGGLLGGVKATAFPVGIGLGASWNVELMQEVGAALAGETKSKGAHMLLAPTVNIQRSVTNGRNFECYSEDPILTAELAAAYIIGLQDEGISATIKHFAGNESEIERTTMSSVIDERSLREVYLIPFEWAVKKAGAKGVMTAYNKVNGTFASEHKWLLTEVLRGDWGFDGLVMSDWFGSHSTAPTVNAGLDLEMPGPSRDRGQKLIAAVEAGEVSRDTVRARARAILSVMEWTGALYDNRPHEERADDKPENRALIRRAGAEGTVLLKNDGLLPIKAGQRIAVIGPNAKVAQIMGGGSSQLNPHYRVSPWDGLVDAVGAGSLSFAPGCGNDHFPQPLLKTELKVEFFAGRHLDGDVVYVDTLEAAETFWLGMVAGGKLPALDFSARLTGSFTADKSGTYQVGIASAGLAKVYVNGKLIADAWTNWTQGRTFFEEGCDEVVGSVDLEAGKPAEMVIEFASKDHATLGVAAFRAGIGLPMGDADIAAAASLAGEADVAVVFVGRNGEWDTEGSDLEDITLPGGQDELISAVARANPNTVVVLQTGGPVDMPWLDQVASVMQSWYPGQEAGNAIADVLLGKAEPGGRLPQTFPVRWSDNPASSQDPKVYPGLDGEVEYREGVFVGYRHYDHHGIKPLFPFGFGLSYTSFACDAFSMDDSAFETEGMVSVSLDIKNTGARAGSIVMQLYVAPQNAPVSRPAKELKAFAKVALAAGEKQRVTLTLDARAFAYFDVARQRWIMAPGAYTLMLGTDAASTLFSASVNQSTEVELRP